MSCVSLASKMNTCVCCVHKYVCKFKKREEIRKGNKKEKRGAR